MANFANRDVVRTFTSNNSQNCWALLSGENNYFKVKTGATDGVTNVFVALCAARANGRKVTVSTDSNDRIVTVYLF